MEQIEKNILARCVSDIDGTLYRFGGNEAVYRTCLKVFLEDNAITMTEAAVANENWADAQAEAHALKGCAGNMGFSSLMKSADRMVCLLRNGRNTEAKQEYDALKECHREVVAMIGDFFGTGANETQ